MTNSIKEKEAMTSFIEKILVSVLMMAMGILFCVIVSAAVSITIGVILCIYGIVNIAIIGVSRRPLFSVMGVVNGLIIATGIAFCTHDLATLVVLMMPFVLNILGAIMIIDAFITFFSLKHGGIIRFIVFLIVGSAMFSLGTCFLCLEHFRLGYCQLVFGVMLCVGSTALLTFSILGRLRLKKEEIV